MHGARKKKLGYADRRTYVPGTTLFMDKTGPHKPPAFFGSKYDHNIMDVSTGVLVVRHYKHKSETKNDIADILLEFTSRSGNPVRTVNFDRAGEYTSPATDQEFRRHGVRPGFMPAYDHNSAHHIEGIQF